MGGDGEGSGAVPEGKPTIGMQTAHIRNKIVRSQKYNKLRHEQKKAKKKERLKKAQQIAKAEELGLEPPPKAVPKVCAASAQ